MMNGIHLTSFELRCHTFPKYILGISLITEPAEPEQILPSHQLELVEKIILQISPPDF